MVILFSIALMSSCQRNRIDDEIPDRIIVNGDDRLYRSSTGVLSYDSLPFSGFIVRCFPDGKMRSKKSYFEGRQQQTSFTFHHNGQIETIRPYLDGQKHGEHLGYHSDGKLRFKYQFKNGLSEGTHFTWYNDGSLKSELNFQDGHEFGSQKVWRSDGKLRSNYVIRENGRRYGMLGIKRCQKIDSETGDMDPYLGETK